MWFASTLLGNKLTNDDEQRKLAFVVKTAEEVCARPDPRKGLANADRPVA
jgi:hypothetical protein